MTNKIHTLGELEAQNSEGFFNLAQSDAAFDEARRLSKEKSDSEDAARALLPVEVSQFDSMSLNELVAWVKENNQGRFDPDEFPSIANLDNIESIEVFEVYLALAIEIEEETD